MKSSGFRLEKCSRYTWENNEGVKVVSTKNWKLGTIIPNLRGMVAQISRFDEANILIPGENDQKVMYSTSNKESQVWAGGVSYINHDCDPNCKFVTKHDGTVKVVTIKAIIPNDEILCNYGCDYFGFNNKFCECVTCEK